MEAGKLKALLAKYPAIQKADAKGRNYIVTMPCRVQWPNLAKPSAAKGATVAKYSVALIIPKGADLSTLRKLATDTALEKFGRDRAEKLKAAEKLKSPIRKQIEKVELGEACGFLEDAEAFWFTASANADYPPQLFGAARNTLALDTPDIYPGAWALAKINAYGYENQGNTGVSFGLLALQKLADDERLATGTANAGNDFAPVDGATLESELAF